MFHRWHYLTQWAPGLRVASKNRYDQAISDGNTYADKTITEVDTDKSIILLHGFLSTAADFRKGIAAVYFVDSETVRIEAGLATGAMTARFQVIELASGVLAIQRGEIQITAGNTYADLTVDAFVAAKTTLFWTGVIASESSPANAMAYVTRTSTTNIRAIRGGSSGSTKVRFELLEWE